MRPLFSLLSILCFFLPAVFHLGCSASIQTSADRRAEAYLQQGLSAKASGQYKKAILCFEKSVREDSSRTEAYLELGDLLISQERDQEAELWLERIPAHAKDNQRFYYLLGTAQFNQNKINESIVHLERVSRTDSHYSEASWKLARLYFRVENYGRALENLQHLIRDSTSANIEKIRSLYSKVSTVTNARSPRTYVKRLESFFPGYSQATRGMLAYVLVMELGESSRQQAVLFKDVPAVDSLAGYYQKALSARFLEFLPDGKFYPYHIVKRRNLAYYLNEIVSLHGPAGKDGGDQSPVISDVSTSDLQWEAIRNVCHWKLMSLRPNNRFDPDTPVGINELVESVQALKQLIRR